MTRITSDQTNHKTPGCTVAKSYLWCYERAAPNISKRWSQHSYNTHASSNSSLQSPLWGAPQLEVHAMWHQVCATSSSANLKTEYNVYEGKWGHSFERNWKVDNSCTFQNATNIIQSHGVTCVTFKGEIFTFPFFKSSVFALQSLIVKRGLGLVVWIVVLWEVGVWQSLTGRDPPITV